MKITTDSNLLEKLLETYGKKAKEVLWTAMESMHGEFSDIDLIQNANKELTYEEIIRRQKKSQRLNVALMENARDILNHLNNCTGKNFKTIETNLRPICSLLKKYSKEKIINVIDVKCFKWKGTDFEDYLRPSTLFNPNKFEGYANESVPYRLDENKFAGELNALLGTK